MSKALIGQQAPSITLPNENGETYTVTPGADGLPLVLFFYPKAGTYGCTKEACFFRDAIAGKSVMNGNRYRCQRQRITEKETFKPEKVTVIGLSADPVAKQKTFVEKNKLTVGVSSFLLS